MGVEIAAHVDRESQSTTFFKTFGEEGRNRVAPSVPVYRDKHDSGKIGNARFPEGTRNVPTREAGVRADRKILVVIDKSPSRRRGTAVRNYLLMLATEPYNSRFDDPGFLYKRNET